MTEPRRLFEESRDDFERALLGSARIDAGSESSRARCVATVAGGLALVSIPAAAAPGLGLSLAAKWMSIGVIAGLGVSGVSVATVRWSAQSTDAIATTPQAHSPKQPALAHSGIAREHESDRAPAPAQSHPVLAPAAHNSGRSGPRALPQATGPSVVPVTVPGSLSNAAAVSLDASSLDREIALLDAARHALAQGDTARAWNALERHRHGFAAGSLGPEALVIRVQTLLARGHRAQAEALAEPFLKERPDGAHAQRLREILQRPVSSVPITNP